MKLRKIRHQITMGIAFSTIIAISQVVPAEPNIPSDDKVLTQTGQASLAELPNHFRLLVWNIHKASEGETWQKDFHALASTSDLVLLQEGYAINTFEQATKNIKNMLWSFATSFVHEGYDTGVVTGTISNPLRTFWQRSPGREPVINTPKMTILSEFDLPQSSKSLLVANIHGINFVTNSLFYEHIAAVITVLEKHDGPIIFAGDFNTWNGGRYDYLKTRTGALGLKFVTFKKDPRKVALDHVLYRGLNTKSAAILEDISSSDHLPLKVEFTLP